MSPRRGSVCNREGIYKEQVRKKIRKHNTKSNSLVQISRHQHWRCLSVARIPSRANLQALPCCIINGGGGGAKRRNRNRIVIVVLLGRQARHV